MDSETEYQYDAFISYSTEDIEWVKKLEFSLESKGADTWVDYKKIKPGQNIPERINEGLEKSRFVLFVMTPAGIESIWRKRETAFIQMAAKEDNLIPLLLIDCKIPPLLTSIRHIDFRNPDDFKLRITELTEVLGIPDKKRVWEKEHDKELVFRGEEAYQKGKGFEKEVAETYRMLGFEVKEGINIQGMQFDLKIQKRDAGFRLQAIVECKDLQVKAKERDQIIAQRSKVTRLYPGLGHFVVSSRGFAEQTKTALLGEGIECLVYKEILSEIFPLDKYVRNLVKDIEEWINDKENWNGEDRFIRPFLLTDISGEQEKALDYFSGWLDDEKLNHLTILGDLGTGKSTLAKFLSYTLGTSFLKDPLKHPAPVLIPLKDVRKAVNLSGIVIHHFNKFGIPDVNYTRFEYLVKKGKIILFFDAFDEMAEKIEWETTRDNFRELNSIVGSSSKVILTCRTHFFINREEQAEILGSSGSPGLSEIETDLYKDITNLPEYRIVYLEEFTDDQILEYLNKTRGHTAKKDFDKIKSIYNLRDLAHRPLLLDMIVKSLPRLEKGRQISASQLYNVYTGIWLKREQEKHPHLNPDVAECMMRLLAWFMWNKGELEISFDTLIPFIREKIKVREIKIKKGNEEILARELATATFLKRTKDMFTFAHKSFSEYFLALHIFKCLTENDSPEYDILKTKRLDQKTIYFLAFLDTKEKAKKLLQHILTEPYTGEISENALTILYWITRITVGMEKEITNITHLQKQMAENIPYGIQMQKSALKGIVLEGAVIQKADFTETILLDANINNAKITETTFKAAVCKNASFINSKFDDCVLDSTDMRGVNAKNALFTRVSLDINLVENAIFTNAGFHDPKNISNIARLCIQKADTKNKGDGKEKQLIPLHQWLSLSSIYSLTTNNTHTLLFAGTGDGSIHLFETTTYARIAVLTGHTGCVNSLVMHKENQLFSGSSDSTIREWDTLTGECIRILKGHNRSVNSLVMHKENQLFSGSSDNTIREWDTLTGECIRILKSHDRSMFSLVISADNKTLYSGSRDNTVIAWDIATGKQKARFVHMEKGMWLCYLPDGRFAGHPKAVQYLSYIDPTTKEVFPAEDLVERFYRPGEVAKALQ